MNMHDKDIDALFRNKLASFEVEPSASVWASINNELGAQQKRKSYAPLLKIAASVAILVTAGMIFLTNKTDVTIKPDNRVAVRPAVKTPVTVQSVTTVNQANPVAKAQPVTNTQPAHCMAQVVSHKVSATQNAITNATQTTAAVVKPTTVTDPQPVSVMAVANSTKSVVPDINLKPTVDEQIVPQTTRVLALNNSGADDDIKAPAKKRKIHGLGGLINAVVGAVDKREDKIIEFTDTDEGDAITGINLGLFKVKKQK